MAYRVVKLVGRIGSGNICYICERESSTTRYHVLVDYMSQLQFYGLCCETCVKGVDAVYNYYYEHHALRYTYVFYDIDTACRYFRSEDAYGLVPELIKL